MLLGLAGCERRDGIPIADSTLTSDIEADLRRVAIEARLDRHYYAGAIVLARTPTSTHDFLDFDNLTREEFIDQLCQPDQGNGLLDRTTAEDFIRANQVPEALNSDSFSNVDWIRPISEERFRSYWPDERSSKEGWVELKKEFPEAIGVVEISAFGWNHDRSEGVIYVGALSPPGIGQGGFFALRLHGSQYSCQQLIMAPTWMTKANKTRLTDPSQRPCYVTNLVVTSGNENREFRHEGRDRLFSDVTLKMKLLIAAPILLVFASCASVPKIESPVSLSDAITTLPSQAVAGMSPEGRQQYLEVKPGDYDELNRRLHLFSDSPEGGDAESMLFLRLFEDADGKTIAASHSARPFADGRAPSKTDTSVYRLESGQWTDITDSVLPTEVPRSSWFRFNEPGDAIPCGRYERFSSPDSRGYAYKFGEATGTIFWRDGRFHYKSKG
ncbi:hypothetical protein [Haloferula chungangensis]